MTATEVLNDSELYKRVRELPRRKTGNFIVVPQEGPFIHPDLPDIEFKTASGLRKICRFQRYGKWNLELRNQHRLEKALRNIAVHNGVDYTKMANSLIGDRVAHIVMPNTTDLTDLLTRIVREEVQLALKGTNKTQFDLKEFVRKIALGETKRLVLEELDFDVKVEGRVFATKNGRRAVNLD